MMPPNSNSSARITFRATVAENIEDPVSGLLMTRAVTLFPCGHTFNEDTVIQCLARNKLCPMDRKVIERHAPNYTVRQLAETAESHPLEEIKHEPSEEAVELFLRGKEHAEKGEHEIAIDTLLQTLQLSPTYEKAQAYLDFCLKSFHSTAPSNPPSAPSPAPLSLFTEDEPKPLVTSSDTAKENYITLLISLLEEPSLQAVPSLISLLENQVEELMSREDEKLTKKEKERHKWAEKLITKDKKASQFVIKKLQQLFQESSLPASTPSISRDPTPLLAQSPTCIAKDPSPAEPSSQSSTDQAAAYHLPARSRSSAIQAQTLPPSPSASLYNAIVQVHFTHKKVNPTRPARILDQIYEIDPNLSVEEKVFYIFQQIFISAASFSPPDFKETSRESKVHTISNYSSYLMSINRLLILQKLTDGTDYLSQQKNKVLSLKKKGELLAQLIKSYKAYRRDITLPDLDGLGLTILPPELGQCPNLLELSLNDNYLMALPAAIGQLSRLKVLKLNNNNLVALPDEIGQLAQLHRLELSNNRLKAVSRKIKRLVNLQWLKLDNNELTALPEAITRLSKLEGLHLGNNRLTVLPDGIEGLFQLKHLWLSNNQLKILPQLPKLKTLRVEGNPL